VLLSEGPVPVRFLSRVAPEELGRLRASEAPAGGGSDGGGGA
jgi:hypothetical protein